MSRLVSKLIQGNSLWLIWFIAITTQTLPLILGYRLIDHQLVITSAHDSLWHVSLINELQRQFPPQHPGFANITLQNYHYLSDIIWSWGVMVFQVPSWWVYYRLAPLVASSLFVVSAYWLSWSLLTEKKAIYLSLTLILFGGSFGYLGSILGMSQGSSANLFMLDQPFDMLTNVHTYLGFSLFLTASGFFAQGIKQNRYSYLLLAGVLLGITYGFKAYASLIGLVSLLIAGIWQVYRNRHAHILAFGFVPGLLICAALHLVTNSSGEGLIFAPGWLLQKMVTDTDRLGNLSSLAVRQTLYQTDKAWFKLGVIYAIQTLLYIIGNLGVRVVGLFLVWRWLKHWPLDTIQVYLVSIIGSSLLVPLLFYQAASAYNIVQFGQYALLITAVISAWWWQELLGSRLKPIISLALVALAVPTSVMNVRSQLDITNRGERVSPESLLGYAYLNQETEVLATVLTHPQSRHNYLMLIPALANRRTFYSGEVMADLAAIRTDERLQMSQEFFNNLTLLERRLELLDHMQVDYIYLEDPQTRFLESSASALGLTSVYENDNVRIYKK